MRIHSGIPLKVHADRHGVVSPVQRTAVSTWSETPHLWELSPAVLKCERQVVALPPVVRLRAPDRPARLGMVALTSTALLAGCMAPASLPWRIDPVYQTSQPSTVSSVRAYVSVARMYEGEGRWEQAARYWRKAAAAAPGDADVHTALGVALSRSRQLDESIDAFRQAVLLVPGNPRALNNLGYALATAGHDEAAADTLRQALAHDPQHALARANLVTIEQRLAQAGKQPRWAASEAHPPAPTPSLTATAVIPSAIAVPPTDAAVDLPQAAAPSALPPMAVDLRQASISSLATAPSLSVNTSPTVAAFATVATVQAVEDASLTAATSSPRTAPIDPAASQPAEPTVVAAVATGQVPIANSSIQPTEPVVTTPPDIPRLVIANGVGIDGAAAKVRHLLRAQGMNKVILQNLTPYRQGRTVVQYRDGFLSAAQQVASSLPGQAVLVQTAALGLQADVRVILGHDRRAELAACVNRNHCAPVPSPALRDPVLAQTRSLP